MEADWQAEWDGEARRARAVLVRVERLREERQIYWNRDARGRGHLKV